MIKIIYRYRVIILLFFLIESFDIKSQEKCDYPSDKNIYTRAQTDSLLSKKPDRLVGYRTNQSGYLSKILEDGTDVTDTTYTIEQVKIFSDGYKINGWLYLPRGKGRFPLVILTNGGGNNVKSIRSFSDWLAPVLAHCGIAAFVHDKRGTGESEGSFVKTTYEDYITDAGNCAKYFAKDKRIDPGRIGVAGASEGGRVAVVAACRYDEIKFVVSFAGTVVSAIDDRINAQKSWLRSLEIPDSSFDEVMSVHEKSIRAWASGDVKKHQDVDRQINEMRKRYENDILPFPKSEMDTIKDFEIVIPTWNSLSMDYLKELEHFNKNWLAIFGELDAVVPTCASVKNICHYMKISGNNNYRIALIPDCGHSPVSVNTKRMIRLDNIIINWINENINNIDE